MYVKTPERDVISSGAKESVLFTIKASAKAFQVFSDKLYSDKVRAVIRELWSNAYDSHLAAGKETVPFDCHLPSWESPEFRVRDYGTSMAHDDVMHLYSTMFESTKETDEKAIGMLGLGSKSPFSYVDAFTVTCWMDGEKRVYSCFTNKQGMPEISHFNTEPSAEPTGLEVSFPVEESDVNEFTRKAKMVSWGFDVLPTMTGAYCYLNSFENEDAVVSGAGWRMFKRTYDHSLFGAGSSSYIRQGVVLYPLDTEQFREHLDDGELTLARSHMVIDCEMGEVDIAPSREGLSYDDVTISNIVKRVKAIRGEVVKTLFDKISDAPSYWVALKNYKSIVEETFGDGNTNVAQMFRHAVDYKGRDLTKTFMVTAHKAKASTNMMSIRKSSHTPSGVMSQTTRRSWKGKWASDYRFEIYPHLTQVYVLYTNDQCPYAMERVYEHFTEECKKTHAIIVKTTRGSMQEKRILVALGRPPAEDITIINDLPKPERNRSTTRSKVQCEYLDDTGAWVKSDISTDDNVLYITTTRSVADDSKLRYMSKTSYTAALSWLKDTKVIEEDTLLVRVPASKKGLIKKGGDTWLDFSETVNTALKKAYTPEIAAAQEVFSRSNTCGSSRSIIKVVEACISFKIVPHRNSNLYPLWAERQIISRVKTRVFTSENEAISRMAGAFGIELPENDVEEAKKSLPQLSRSITQEQVQANYPMLGMLSDYSWSSYDRGELRAVLDYIEMCDNRNLTTKTA